MKSSVTISTNQHSSYKTNGVFIGFWSAESILGNEPKQERDYSDKPSLSGDIIGG